MSNIVGDNDNILKYIKKENDDTEDSKNEDDDNIIIGIDLGTTNSCVSIWRNNNVEIIPDEFGNKTIPSCVSYTNVSKYIGIEAKKQKEINTENVFYEVKRIIGRQFDEKVVKDFSKYLSYKMIKNERGGVSLQSTVRDNAVFTPEEISANILMKMKSMAKIYLKKDIVNAVITVPAHFTDSQRQSTKDAAEIAGLNCLRMIHEPTAAALAYGVLDRSIKKVLDDVDGESEMTILVYDLGGGTLDCSLMKVNNGIFEVLGSAGISYFGGIDFDNRLMGFCMAKFSRQYFGGAELDNKKLSRVNLQKLRSQCELAKKILSDNLVTNIAIENFYEGKNLFVKITREQFENLCNDLFLLCMKSVDDILEECEVQIHEVDEVILVGGMTRMPRVRNLLSTKFTTPDGKKRINCSVNPDEAISVGAAVQGYILLNKGDAFSDSVTLIDVMPLSLGVEVMGECMDIVIKRNSPIPCEVSKMYSTDDDYIDSVIIKIYEGERMMTKNNTFVGEFILGNIPKYPRGMPEIEIVFNVDLNGIVTVTASEKENLEKNQIVVNSNKNGLKPYQIKALVEESRQQEVLDELERMKKVSYYEIDDLCSNVIMNVKHKDCKMSDKEKEKIKQDMMDTLDWLKSSHYSVRDIDEYENVSDSIKRKYGTLIIHGKIENDKVKAMSDVINATTLYKKDDDEEENEMKEAFGKALDSELGDTIGMTDQELTEMKELRKTLEDLCENVFQIIYSEIINLDKNHRKEILYHMDDMMLWLHSHERPTKRDYIEKIDWVNEMCNQISDHFENDSTMFNSLVTDCDNNLNSEKLEKICLMLTVMITNHQIPGSKAAVRVFEIRIQNALNHLYSFMDTPGNTKDLFEKKCEHFIEELNDECNKLYERSYGIFANKKNIMDEVMKVNVINEKQKIIKDNPDSQQKIFEENLDSQQSKGNKYGENAGMSIMELIHNKQNEELDDIIEKMLHEEIEDGKSKTHFFV
jgi:heat shock 70kDa protein 1/2/6/8